MAAPHAVHYDYRDISSTSKVLPDHDVPTTL
jgi:hypothetical protein